MRRNRAIVSGASARIQTLFFDACTQPDPRCSCAGCKSSPFLSNGPFALTAQPFLPEYTIAVLDEAAHDRERRIGSHGILLSHYAFEHWMRRLYVPEIARDFGVLRDGEAVHIVTPAMG